MKLYIKSNSQAYQEAFNRIQESLVLGKKDRTDIIDYLDNLYDEDKLTEEEYDKLSDNAWKSLKDASPYESIKEDCPLAVTFYDNNWAPYFTIYDVSNEFAIQYALLDERHKNLIEIYENSSNNSSSSSILYDYVGDILGRYFDNLNDVFVEYAPSFKPNVD